MEKTEFSVYELARSEFPRKWYEEESLILAPTILTAALVFWALDTTNWNGMGIPLSTLSAIVCIAGRLADVGSTLSVFKVVDYLFSNGIAHPVHESNPWIGKHPSSKDILGRGIVIDGICVAISATFPPVGFAMGIGSAIVALNNHRKLSILNRAANIAKTWGILSPR